MNTEIEKCLSELVKSDYRWNSSFLKKIRLLIGIFYDQAPDYVINCSEKLSHHIQLEKYQSDLMEVIRSYLRSNKDVAKNLEQYKEMLDRREFDEPTIDSISNFYIDRIEIDIDIKYLLSELKNINGELKNIQTNYSEIINWIYSQAIEKGFVTET